MNHNTVNTVFYLFPVIFLIFRTLYKLSAVARCKKWLLPEEPPICCCAFFFSFFFSFLILFFFLLLSAFSKKIMIKQIKAAITNFQAFLRFSGV